MKEGFYWVRYNGSVQIARFVEESVENVETGEVVSGYWQYAGDDMDTIYSPETEVLSAKLVPPEG
ncbi:hypothetical protein M976_02873 [Buttiauxella ferragutiae ATCC 51602]|uniref:Uncharacterized protein n=1 Tax=Buttiauxella ferragutiae ATCC 51602 TaxID=1354252 RepID=A0ABX2W6X5_9ENTR|nr:hypothetical protein [Buttiauxella ferragutiae]OAT26712.1 hypothetical protein M976_02873 [Buttiauxella ferragutiae ATCC 51602]